MARDRGDFYQGIDPNQSRPAPRGQLGALVGMQGGGEAPGQPASMRQMMQPQEDVATLRERNKVFLRDPQTQAALMTFAMGMMQPISSSGDLMGLFSNSLMNSARAVAGVEMAQAEEQEALRKAMLEERKFGLDVRQVDMAERELEAKLGTAGQKTRSKVITAKDPLNARFGLGLTGNQQAKVEITEDADGNVLNADLEAEFGGEGEATPTNIAKLQRDRDKAKAEGRLADAQELQNQINEESLSTVTSEGRVTVPDPNAPGGVRQELVQGGKAAAELERIDKADEANRRIESAKHSAVVFNIDDAISMIENPMQFGGVTIPANTILTGFGALSKYVPGTPAKDLAERLGSIGARIQLDELQKMREASSTGGSGLGNVSNFEGMTLRNAYYSLAQEQTAAQLVQNLKRFRLMFDDVVNGGQVGTIAKQVKKGEVSFEEGERLVNNLFGVEQLQNTIAPPAEAEPDISQAPPTADARTKRLWRLMPEATRREFLKGLTE